MKNPTVSLEVFECMKPFLTEGSTPSDWEVNFKVALQGWLLADGVFYPCASYSHIYLADLLSLHFDLLMPFKEGEPLHIYDIPEEQGWAYEVTEAQFSTLFQIASSQGKEELFGKWARCRQKFLEHR